MCLIFNINEQLLDNEKPSNSRLLITFLWDYQSLTHSQRKSLSW